MAMYRYLLRGAVIKGAAPVTSDIHQTSKVLRLHRLA
jgi:hypothetical protein